MPAWLGPLLLGGSSIIGGALGSRSAERAGDTAANASLQAAREAVNFARESRDLGLSLSEPQREAGYAATAGMMDMLGLSRARTPDAAVGGLTAAATPDGTTSPQTAAPQAATPQVPKPYPPPPNNWQGTPTEWRNVVDAWYDNPDALRNARPQTELNGASIRTFDGWWLANYIGESVNDFFQGLQENVNSDNVATLIDPNTGLPVPYLGGAGPAFGQSGVSGAASYDASQAGTGSDALANRPQFNWQESPGYQFRFNEGMRAIDNSASARGMTLSGGTLRGITEYGQNMATQEFDNIFNRLGVLAGYGSVGTQGAQNVVNNSGAQMAAAAGYTADAGASRASGYLGAGNAWANAANQFAIGIGDMFGNR